VSVEEVLVPLSVPVHAAFSRIAEQCVGEPGEGAQLCLVALTGHVDDDSLTA